ncbi:SMI1/KNR4 family protein [Deinococcus sp.]|uniref:SMI1/KNR4 family protein n=1 Tax=Deinococcus sp. TaxID=47478 RepID=UPI0025CDB197|nr:SMI1/KNR4 family protein [Deinococcus sp.]
MTDADTPLTDVLAQIDAWYLVNVPAIHATLRPGVTDAELDALEQKTKLKLPEAFRTLYKWHDGDGGGIASFGLGLVRLAHVQFAWNTWQDVAADWPEELDLDAGSFPAGAIQQRYSTPGWLGFLEDWGGNYVGVDFNPGPAGTVGQVITFGRDEEKKYVLANSLEDFLREYERRLSTGQASVVKLEGYDQETLSIQLHDSRGRHTEGYHVLADLFPGFGAAPDDRRPRP